MAEVLVTGATGKTGREVVALLQARPEVTIRAASRSSAVRLDWHDPSTYAAAAGDARVAYLVRPDIEDAPERLGAFLDAAPGLEHVVLLSEIGAETADDATWERRVEAAVTARAAGWTLLRATWFAQVLTDPAFYAGALRDQGELALPSGGAAITFVDARDIAAVAVAVLLDPATHAGQAYDVTGPAALTVAQVAAHLSAVTGREIRATDPPIAEAAGAYGDPWLAGVLERVYGRVHDGTAGRTSDAVQRVTGSAPRTLEAFVAEHREVWLS